MQKDLQVTYKFSCDACEKQPWLGPLKNAMGNLEEEVNVSM